MKNNKGFNLIAVIVIICVVSIVSGLTTGIIIMNSYHGYLTDDSSLNEFLNTYADIVNNYYDDINKEEMLGKAIDAMLDYLGDDYTTYMNSEERQALEDKLKGTYEGIGLSYKNKTIVKVYDDTPASKAGLQAGDEIIKINGKSTENLVMIPAGYINGGKEKEVKLTVLRNGTDELEFTLNIETINTPLDSEIIENTTIGYLSVPIFSRKLSVQVNKELQNLEQGGMDRLIIDLRDNSGGYLEEANNVASIFLPKDSKIYSLEDKNDKQDYYDITDEKKEYPIIVLINEKTASAAEILASALKDSYGAILVGTKSYGKGKVQQTLTMSDGSMAKYTSAKWYRPNGTCIDGIGINPDNVVEYESFYDEEGNRTKLDTQLQKAVDIISTL